MPTNSDTFFVFLKIGPSGGTQLSRNIGDGALIAKSAKAILAGGPAAKAGMKAGDIITSIDGRAITSPEELIVAIRAKNVGDSIKVTFKRGSEIKTATLTLTAAK